MVRHLTSAWIEALDAAARANDELRRATADTALVVQQVVTQPEGEISWYLEVDHGRVGVRAGRAEAPDLTFTQDRATAEEVASGRLSAQAVFMVGRLRVGGDLAALQAHHGMFAELPDVFAQVRTITDAARQVPSVPELPEVQAHVERLDADLVGAELTRFAPLSFTALKTASPSPDEAIGQKLVFVGRRGKYLLLDMGTVTFVVHLMQGGRLKPDEKQSAKPRGGIARWRFADGRALLLTEAGSERKAGVWVVAGDPEEQVPLAGLGPDADQVPATMLGDLMAENSMRLHGFLRDQHLIAGLGRRLANEICHRAKLSPFATTSKLDRTEVESVAEAIGACVNESLAYERGRGDMSSSRDRPSHVHHREGQPCPVCADTVRAVEYRSYTVNYCPTCQTDGRLLADNTTSKFLK